MRAGPSLDTTVSTHSLLRSQRRLFPSQECPGFREEGTHLGFPLSATRAGATSEGTSLSVPAVLSPTTNSCSSAAAATEEPRDEGKVHSSSEGPVETAVDRSTFWLSCRSAEQELSAILLLPHSACLARGKDRRCHGQRGFWGGAPAPCAHVGGAPPRSLTLSTITKRSWRDESLLAVLCFFHVHFFSLGLSFLVDHCNHNNDHFSASGTTEELKGLVRQGFFVCFCSFLKSPLSQTFASAFKLA